MFSVVNDQVLGKMVANVIFGLLLDQILATKIIEYYLNLLLSQLRIGLNDASRPLKR